MKFDTESTIAIVAAVKELTIHATVKNPDDVAEAFKKIYAAVVEAITESQGSSSSTKTDKQ